MGYADHHSLIATSLITLGMAMGAAGFLSAAAPALIATLRSPVGLSLLTLGHLLMGLFAVIRARHLVADALQLPRMTLT